MAALRWEEAVWRCLPGSNCKYSSSNFAKTIDWGMILLSKPVPKVNLKPGGQPSWIHRHLQLSISNVQFCSSSGYRLRSIMQAAVVVILEEKWQCELLVLKAKCRREETKTTNNKIALLATESSVEHPQREWSSFKIHSSSQCFLLLKRVDYLSLRWVTNDLNQNQPDVFQRQFFQVSRTPLGWGCSSCISGDLGGGKHFNDSHILLYLILLHNAKV